MRLLTEARAPLLAALLAGGTICFSPRASLADETATPQAPHGGKLCRAGSLWAETCCDPDGFRVYLFDAKGQPLPATGLRGLVLFRLPGEGKVTRMELFPERSKHPGQNCLFASRDLTKCPEGQVGLRCYLAGAPGQGSRPIQFAQRFPLRLDPEKLAIAKQRVCPVTGVKLGKMGPPQKTSVGGHTVYVCCEPCVDELKESPQKYLAAIGKEYRAEGAEEASDAEPTRAGAADKQAIERQKTCPVMGAPLGAMGAPWKIRLKGRTVFVCCKGCIKRLKAKPDHYLAKLPKQSGK